MKQLFVCHTQYNLILAVGLAESSDDLVLFRDFNLTDTLRTRLESYFNNSLFLEGNYPKKELSAKEKLKKITRDNEKLKAYIGVYDRIFIVDDMCIQEMYVMKCAFQKNKAVEMAWLEDGTNAYFSNGVISAGMGATPVKRFIRRITFTFRFGLRSFYDLADCMGGHKKLTSAYVTFPMCIRTELKSKNLVQITDEQFHKGMEFMYAGEAVEFTSGSILIAMDKLDVYGELWDKVNQLIEKIINATSGEVYYKYHPRETDDLPALENCIELDRRVALESYLTNSNTKEITVVGVKSTALQTAKKMGYKTISLINQVEQNEAVISFYKSIGVECK